MIKALLAACGALVLAACLNSQKTEIPASSEAMGTPARSQDRAAATSTAGTDTNLPADATTASARLARSPRHGEWVLVSPGSADSLRAWIVFPERRERAPVVVVIHEIFGLTPWIRAVADQLAAEGFIAIAPDFLTGKGLPGFPDSVPSDAAVAAVRSLDPAWVQRQIGAAAQYAMRLPAALPRYGVVGFCWGGTVSFNHAVNSPIVAAAVVYYGSSPPTSTLASVRAPVLGLYGADDARVNATVPAADSAMRAMGKTFSHQVYSGAGHGFLRQQNAREGANMRATEQAWPATIEWFRRHLGR